MVFFLIKITPFYVNIDSSREIFRQVLSLNDEFSATHELIHLFYGGSKDKNDVTSYYRKACHMILAIMNS